MTASDWEHLLQVAKKCTRYAAKSFNEPYSDDLESEGQYIMYTYATKYRAGACGDMSQERYVAFWVIRLVKQYIKRNRKRGKRWVEYRGNDKLALSAGNGHAEGLLSNVDPEDEIFISRILEGLPCSKKNEMLKKYCPEAL